MWDILEFIVGVFEFIASWRFFTCLLLALGVVGIVYWFVPDRNLCLWFSIPVAAVGIGTGIVWEWRDKD
jgi:hypothetical protein